MDPRPIGVFDSGLGGLTAVRQLRRVLPGEDIVYFGDTGRVPYGSRGRDIIVQYARQDIRFLLQQDVKFIIAACGTVSSTYPPEEAAKLPVPFTGVVGATARAAVDATRNKKVGIIGTAATVRSGSYAAVIRDMMPEVEIFARACPMFVPLVENGYFNDGNPVTKLIIAEYLQELKDAGVDTLILGCTHYPAEKDDRRFYGRRRASGGFRQGDGAGRRGRAGRPGAAERQDQRRHGEVFCQRHTGQFRRAGPHVLRRIRRRNGGKNCD